MNGAKCHSHIDHWTTDHSAFFFSACFSRKLLARPSVAETAVKHVKTREDHTVQRKAFQHRNQLINHGSRYRRHARIIPKLGLHIVLARRLGVEKKTFWSELLHKQAVRLPVCMPGICHSSAPQCSGHRTGRPGPVYRLKHKRATTCRCRPPGLVIARTGKKRDVRLIQGLHAKWTWFVLQFIHIQDSSKNQSWWLQTRKTCGLFVLIAHYPVARNQRSRHLGFWIRMHMMHKWTQFANFWGANRRNATLIW